MNTSVARNPEISSQRASIFYQARQPRGLFAKWFVEDGRLVCRWFPASTYQT